MQKVIVDPVKAAEKFKADLAFMAAGQRSNGVIVRHALDKNFGLNVGGLMFNEWGYRLQENETAADADNPSFWSGQAEKIMGHDKANPKGRGDTICLRKLDTGEHWKLLIIEIGKGFVRTRPIEQSTATAVNIPDDSPLTTRWNVGRRMHQVIRKNDGEVMHAEGFQSKEAAAEWIDKHRTAMKAA